MKKISKVLLLGAMVAMGLGLYLPTNSYADEAQNVTEAFGTSISLTPVSKILQIASNSTYDSEFTVKNDGDSVMKIEVYAAPYSYVYSEEENSYKLGFNNENNYTQISRWVTFKDSNGNYVEKTTFSIAPHDSIDIDFKITTPNNIPNGGQYAVIFAHTLSDAAPSSGIRTEVSPGMVIYGRSTEGQSIISAEITNLEIKQNTLDNTSNSKETTNNNFYASAKIKNTGNVDFNASGVLKVEPIIGFGSYETPATSGRLSVIPEVELTLTDEWTEVPSFGLYKITWTVTAGDTTEQIEKVVFLISPLMIILTIIFLTIIIVWIIISVRRRKERHSRLAV